MGFVRIMLFAAIVNAGVFAIYSMNIPKETSFTYSHTDNGIVYATDGTQYVNTDSLFVMKTNSDISEIDRRLSYRGSFNATVIGINMPAIGLRYNIIGVEKAKVVYQKSKDDDPIGYTITKAVAKVGAKAAGIDSITEILID